MIARGRKGRRPAARRSGATNITARGRKGHGPAARRSGATNITARSVFFAALLLSGCDHNVHIRLATSGPIMAKECNLAVLDMLGFKAELENTTPAKADYSSGCVKLRKGLGQPTSLDQLESFLADKVAFEDVPVGDKFILWVEGFSTGDCSKAGARLLCGREGDPESPITLPPTDDEIVVQVGCSVSIPWTSEGLANCSSSR